MKVFNHGIHILLDVLSCGLWLPVHLILWACAPTVPINYGTPSAAASANTTVVFGNPGAYPQVMHNGQPPFAQQPYPQPHQQHAPAVPQRSAPPAWAIEEARERLPQDAPWNVVESVAMEYVARKELEPPTA